ncbi:MAG: glycosyltransferase family 2 protein [Candidatus Peribacteraceae bacterium]|nr:glycosyltransferase family 2 protein [Candidatus Peribacteraceae bacterium]
MIDLSVQILTHNEEKNIEKCIRSVLPLTNRIFVVDSGSTDKTVDVCEKYNVIVKYREWTNYAEQLNWGLDNFDFGTEWIMRLDADEELTPELVEAIKKFIDKPPKDVSGVYVKRRVYFMGRWIKHGGYYPTWLLRVFKNGIGRCENLWMDEHIVVSEGETIQIHEDLIDKNNKDLTFWTDKHNKYSDREVLDIINKMEKSQETDLSASLGDGQASSRRWIKDKVYLKFPLFVRPLLYFIYRYFIKLGFLDGKEGLIFHFLQGFWYRFLVDAKYFEYKKRQSEET